MLITPVDGTALPDGLEIAGLENLLFCDDDQATYEIPLEELLALFHR